MTTTKLFYEVLEHSSPSPLMLRFHKWIPRLTQPQVINKDGEQGFELMRAMERDTAALQELSASFISGEINPATIWSTLKTRNVRYTERDDISIRRAPLWELWDVLVAKASLRGSWDYGESPHRERWFLYAMEMLPWEKRIFLPSMQRINRLIERHAWAWDMAMHTLIWESTNIKGWPNRHMAHTETLLALPGVPAKHCVDALVYQLLEKKRSTSQGDTESSLPAWNRVQERFAPYIAAIEQYVTMDEMVHGVQMWHEREERLCRALLQLFKMEPPGSEVLPLLEH